MCTPYCVCVVCTASSCMCYADWPLRCLWLGPKEGFTVQAGAEVWTFCLYMCGFMFVNAACPPLTTVTHMPALPEAKASPWGGVRSGCCVASKPHGHNQQPCVQCILCYKSRACTHGMVGVESWAPQFISNQYDTTPKCTHGVSGYLPAIAGTSCPL